MAPQESSTICDTCKRPLTEGSALFCKYCGKAFCEEDYTRHMAWEKRHEGLAEDIVKLWRRRRGLQPT